MFPWAAASWPLELKRHCWPYGPDLIQEHRPAAVQAAQLPQRTRQEVSSAWLLK
jgi:hypothetical protein